MNNCAVIKDLLPLYVDNVLSEESKTLVVEHLANCEGCKCEFANMQSEVKKLNHGNKAEVKVLKSVKKKLFRQKVIVAVIAVIVTVSTVFIATYFRTTMSFNQLQTFMANNTNIQATEFTRFGTTGEIAARFDYSFWVASDTTEAYPHQELFVFRNVPIRIGRIVFQNRWRYAESFATPSNTIVGYAPFFPQERRNNDDERVMLHLFFSSNPANISRFNFEVEENGSTTIQTGGAGIQESFFDVVKTNASPDGISRHIRATFYDREGNVVDGHYISFGGTSFPPN